MDEAFAAAAHEATLEFQQGRPGYRALWKHIMGVSVPDLKKNYDKLGVSFESWLGESDAQPYIPPMLERMEQQGLLEQSEGAWVIQVQEPTDTKEVPPCIIKKSDGATLYATTDLATIWQRMQTWNPYRILYVVDKRQEMHFTQVFRAAKKAAPAADEGTGNPE